MPIELKTTEPQLIIAGDTLQWRKSLSDFPATTWTLSYKLVGDLDQYEITTSASASDHIAYSAAADTKLYAPGEYTLFGKVTDGTYVYSIQSKKVTISSTGAANKSVARRTLDLLNSALESQGANAWVQSYGIAGRTMTFRSAAEFLEFRSKMIAEVGREERASRIKMGLKANNKISVRM